jgi:hypothetical protein
MNLRNRHTHLFTLSKFLSPFLPPAPLGKPSPTDFQVAGLKEVHRKI